LEKAQQASEILFGRATEEALRTLDEKTLLAVFAGVPQFEVSLSLLDNGEDIINLLAVETKIFSSKGEARKMIQANGVSINKTKITLDKTVGKEDLVKDKYLIVQKGKKNYFLVIFS